jgi:hypothetical protein
MKSAVSGITITGVLLPTLALAKGGSKATDLPHCVVRINWELKEKA